MWHNEAAVDYQLVNCFNGFFVQVTVDVNSILMDNIWLAAPLIIPQLHIDQVVLTDPQLLQVTAFVPGRDTLISSRALTMIERRNRVFTILDSTLRQRFTDMSNVGFLLLTAHPSSKWMDPAFSPQKEKVVVVYSDEVLQGSASVLLRLSLPPHDAEGAIYVIFFWLGAAWVKSRAERPSVSGVNRQLHVQIGCKLGIRNRKNELTKQAKRNKLQIKAEGN